MIPISSSIKSNIREHLLTPYQQIVERYKADRVLFQVNDVTLEVSLDWPLTETPRMLVTTGCGLYLINDGKISQLLSGWFFGLTRNNDGQYYIFQNLDVSGRIFTFRLEKNRIIDLKLFQKTTPKTIHQITFFDAHLFVCDTSNNCIRMYNSNGKLKNKIYPNGKLSSGKNSSNYSHFNSIYPVGDEIHVIAHNYTQYSKKHSDIFILDRKTYRLIDIKKNIGSCCHNIIAHNDLYLTCDSLYGNLRNNNKIVFEKGQFTRGLSLNNEMIVVGGSMYGKRAERIGKDCFLYFLSLEFNYLGSVTLKNIGPCFDIRLVDLDYGIGT